jgi:hypothetical protein
VEFYQSDDKLQRIIFSLMQSHVGFDNRIERRELVRRVKRLMQTSDRQVRDAISELPIISTSKGGGGYWLPANDTELNEWVGEMTSRIAQIHKRITIARAWMNETRQPVRVEQLEWLGVER